MYFLSHLRKKNFKRRGPVKSPDEGYVSLEGEKGPTNSYLTVIESKSANN